MAEYTMVKPPRRALAVWRIRALLLTFFPGFLCSLIFSFLSLGWLIATGIWIAVFLYFIAAGTLSNGKSSAFA